MDLLSEYSGGTLRALRPDTLDATIQRMTAMAHGVAAAHGCTAEVTWGGTRPVYPPTVNDAGAWEFVKGVAEGYACMHMCRVGLPLRDRPWSWP